MIEAREQIYNLTSGIVTTFFNKASEGAAYPYLVFSFLSSPRKRADSEQTKIRLLKVQFDLFGESGLDALADSTEVALDVVANYSFSSNTLISVFEDFRNGPYQIPRDDSAALWQLTFQYTFKLKEN